MIHIQVVYYNELTKNGKLYPNSYITLNELYFKALLLIIVDSPVDIRIHKRRISC